MSERTKTPVAAPLVSLVHLGCARNLIDSELILARMAEEGLLVTSEVDGARAVVVNTCSFIGPAREESKATIEAMVERKRAGDLDGVVVAGCLVQRYKEQLCEEYPEVDLFAEISDYRKLASQVRSMLEGGTHERYLESPGLRPPEREDSRLLATPGSYAYLRISHGCDHTCSFCAIPAIRGPHRSKRPSAVLQEASELIHAGVRELVLVAEDSTAWGRDFGMELPLLVEALAELEGEHTVRLMYAYPNRFPWKLAALMREHPKVLPYLDIPMQHAATDMLRAMRRAGSGDVVRETLSRLRDEVPGITLRTTFLLGFPGETEEHVDELVELVREFRLGRLGAFTYSPEEGTPGHDLAGRIPNAVAVERQMRVLAARDEVLRAAQEELVGGELEVLIDEADDPDELVARGDMDAPEVDLVTLVRGADGQAGVGDRVRVRVDAVGDELDLEATVVR